MKIKYVFTAILFILILVLFGIFIFIFSRLNESGEVLQSNINSLTNLGGLKSLTVQTSITGKIKTTTNFLNEDRVEENNMSDQTEIVADIVKLKAQKVLNNVYTDYSFKDFTDNYIFSDSEFWKNLLTEKKYKVTSENGAIKFFIILNNEEVKLLNNFEENIYNILLTKFSSNQISLEPINYGSSLELDVFINSNSKVLDKVELKFLNPIILNFEMNISYKSLTEKAKGKIELSELKIAWSFIEVGK